MLLLNFLNARGQEIVGTISRAETHEALSGVEILNETSKVTTTSDDRGFFRIAVQNFPVYLKISALGFKTQQLKLTKKRNLNVLLQTSTENLAKVVLRSTHIPKELQKVPAAVNVISAEELQRGDNINLVENFNKVPGMYVNEGALNTNKLNIRGIGARAQYSTNRIQSYIDGIPLTTAEGELTLDDIDQESLEKIEIIKGPTSSIYGAGLGGVINLYTANPGKETSKVAVKSRFGSYESLKNSVLASYSDANSAYFANYNHVQSEGYRDNGDYERNSFMLNGKLRSSEDNQLSFLANFTKLKAYIPSSLNEEDFKNIPQTAAPSWAASRGYESYKRGILGVSNRHSFSRNFSNTSSVYLNFRDAYEPRPFNILKEERVSAGVRSKFNWKTSLFKQEMKLSFGAEYYREWYETGTFQNNYEDFENRGSVLGERLSNNEQNRNYANFFAQANFSFSEKFQLEAGVNLNTTQYTLTDLFTQDEVDQSGDYRFKTILSPRLGATYEIAAGKNLYASLSHGFSTPTVAETLTPEGQINTALEPETGWNYEVGFKGNWFKNAVYTEIAFYSIQVSNLLVAQRVAEDQYVGINAGKTNHNGIEILMKYQIALGNYVLQPYANAAFNFFEFDRFINNGSDYSGNKLPGVPASTLNFGLEAQAPFGLSFYANFRNVGKIALNDANSKYAENYQLLNIKAAYSFFILPQLQLTASAGINNLFDEKYASSVLPNAVGFGGAAPRYYYPGRPRNYFGGIGLSLEL